MLSDLRFALRQLARSPGFTLVAVLSLALGIGANTTIFSVVNAVLLRPPPFRDPARVVSVHATNERGQGFHSFSWLDYADYRDRARTLAGLAAHRTLALQIEGDEGASSPLGVLVSGNYFDVVGTPAAVGRTFRAADGEASAVVISDALWRRRFNADPAVVGRPVVLNGQPLTVVGVMPPEFTGPTVGVTFDAFVPAHLAALVRANGQLLTDRRAGGFELVGRLAPGATREAARAELQAIAAQIQQEHPREGGRQVRVEQASFLFQQFRAPFAAFGGFLMAIVGIVLLAACANLANLLLARAAARRREIGVRIALGAGRGRLVRQLLAESVLLALVGAVAALVVALWATDALMRFRPPLPAPVHLDVPLDGRVLLFTFGVALLTGVLFGLAPALQATRSDVVSALRGDAALPTRSRLRGALVGTQVAVSLVLLVAAGLFLRSLRNARDADVGFDARSGILADVSPGLAGRDEARGREYVERLLERAAALPGVRGATVLEVMPLGLSNSETALWPEGACCDREARVRIDFGRAGPGFFATLGVPLRRGRDFTRADREGAPRVVVVNETLARRLWGSADPVGRRVRLSGMDSGWVEVVGVARDGKYRSLGEEPRAYAWVPFHQWYEGRITLLVRTDADPASVLPALRRAATEVDARVPLTDVTTIEGHLRIARTPAQIAGTLLGLFGALALVLAAVGVYGVMAFVVARRRREIGIRMALGARAADVVRLVVRQGMRPVLVGAAAGLALALGLARLVAGLLYGVRPADPATFAGITALLSLVALLAAWLPARRAARVSPVEALRAE